MPPQKQIFADKPRILRSILEVVQAWVVVLEAERDELPEHWKCTHDRYFADAAEGWIDYSLETFSGRDDLSPSEKQTWRIAVRELAADGCVERHGKRIRLTTKGKNQVELKRRDDVCTQKT